MSHLAVIPGGSHRPRAFSMNAHGVAKYMLASHYAARRVVEDYAFPDEERAKIIRPVPAREVVLEYFRSGRSDHYIAASIAQHEIVPFGETTYEQGRRRSTLAVAKHLSHFAGKLPFDEVRRPRPMSITISELPVKASLDFLCKLENDDTTVAVIFNVATDVSDSSDKLARFAKIECEIAWQITREHLPSVGQIWYIDALSEKIIRKHAKSLRTEWRNIETACDNIMMTYRTLVARRLQAKRTQA